MRDSMVELLVSLQEEKEFAELIEISSLTKKKLYEKIDDLKEKELITSSGKITNQRNKRYFLTEKGRKVLDKEIDKRFNRLRGIDGHTKKI